MMPHFLRLAIPLALASVLVVINNAPTLAQQSEVHAVNNTFTPAVLTVPVGTTIRFVNDDTEIHDVVQRGGGFDSGLLFQGNSWSYTFDTPGIFEYVCLPHPFMSGTITVE